MGKASKWFRGLLGLKKSDPVSPATPSSDSKQPSKRRWSFGKSSSRQTTNHPIHDKTADEQILSRAPAPPQSPVDNGSDSTKHAVAEATAAVAEAAVAAAHAAAEVVRLTSGGRDAGNVNGVSHGSISGGFGSREEWAAAVKIQSHFRAYLSRRALRALKGLVKLQALVRGDIVRKQYGESLQRMQAILRVQTRARALRAQIYESSHSTTKFSHFHHPGPATPEKFEHAIRKNIEHDQSYMLKRNGSRSNARVIPDKEKVRLNYSMDEESWEQRVYSSRSVLADEGKSNKIYEIDTEKSHITPKRRSLFQSTLYPSASDPNSHSFTTSKDSTIHQTIPSPSSCEIQSFSPLEFRDEVEEQFYSASSKGGSSMRGPLTPSRRSDTSRSCLSGYSDFPNYMSYTESSRAKVRSLSAPRQRSQLERSNTMKRFSIHMRSSSTQRVSSTLHANFTSKAYPGSGRLDRLGMPIGGGGDGVGFSGGLWNKY